jgi:hypothetical protein
LSFTGFFTCFTARAEFWFCPVNARPLLANRERADRFTLVTMRETMKQRYGLVRRPWGVFYLKDKITGSQTSLKTDDKHEAQRLLQARNECEAQPAMNLSLARVYLRRKRFSLWVARPGLTESLLPGVGRCLNSLPIQPPQGASRT